MNFFLNNLLTIDDYYEMIENKQTIQRCGWCFFFFFLNWFKIDEYTMKKILLYLLMIENELTEFFNVPWIFFSCFQFFFRNNNHNCFNAKTSTVFSFFCFTSFYQCACVCVCVMKNHFFSPLFTHTHIHSQYWWKMSQAFLPQSTIIFHWFNSNNFFLFNRNKKNTVNVQFFFGMVIRFISFSLKLLLLLMLLLFEIVTIRATLTIHW